MSSPLERRPPEAQAEQLVESILKAARGWAREAPAALQPAVRAVTIRLAEMVSDQRNYFAPLSAAKEAERTQTLALVAKRLSVVGVAEGLQKEFAALTELELKSTGSWALVPAAQGEWGTTAIKYLENAAKGLPESDRPDPYWADDVVAGVLASVRAVLGVDEMHARTESQFGRRTGEHQIPD